MIYVIGIGPGAPSYGLLGSEEIYQKADYILGSERHLEILPAAYQEKGVVPPKKLAELAQLIESYPEDANILYLASGDPLIYGLGKWLSEKFKGRVVVQPGISSFQYLASKVFLPMNDAYLTSSHAKIPNFDFILSLPKVFMVTDKKIGPYEIAQEVKKRGLKKVLVIGENLSYEDENIEVLAEDQVVNRQYEMNVVVILDEGFGIY